MNRFLAAIAFVLLAAFLLDRPVLAQDLYDLDQDDQGFSINQRGEVFPYGDPQLNWVSDKDSRDNLKSGALRLDLDLQGGPDLFDATILQSADWGLPDQQTFDLSAFDRLSVMVYVPDGGPDNLEAVVFTKSGQAWSWSQGPWTTLCPGQWNRLSIETSWISAPGSVGAMGVKIGGNLSNGGTVHIDRFYAARDFQGLNFDFDYKYRIVTASGYTSATPALYSPESGFGYKSLRRIYSASRVIEYPLWLDFHYSGFDGEFLVDLEPGAYEVTIHFGDIYNAVDRLDIFAEGDLMADDLSAEIKTLESASFTVDVTDGQLNLVFHNDGGQTPFWIVNGVEVNLPEVDSEPPVTAASLPGGTYTGGQEITLTSNESATIYYTTNGSEPSTGSAVYVQPIPLAGDANIRFFGVDTEGNVEAPCHSIQYEVFLPGNEQRFDFDASSSVETAVGYQSVPVAPYDASAGFGYKALRRIYSVRQAFGNALLRDSHYSGYDSEFMIDTQNGPYTVLIHMGDRFQTLDQIDILVKGQLMLSNLSTAAGTFRADSFDVEVTDGQLNLEFRDNGGQTPFWMINGIELVYTGADTTPPVSMAVPPGGQYTGPLSIVLTANEAADIFYTTDGSEPSDQSSIYSDPIDVTEDTTLRFFARDLAGNVESHARSESYVIQPPEPYSFSIDVPSTGMTYAKLETDVSWDGSGDYANPFNPQEIKLTGIFTSPGGRRWEVPGFWDGSGWLIRFSPDETGDWNFQAEVVDYAGTNTSESLVFSCTASDSHGWLKIASTDPHYFVHDDGTPFWGVGHNRCWSLDQLGWSAQDGYTLLTDMADAGMNFLGFWMAPWDTQLVTLDTGYDRYDMNRATELDAIVEDAEGKGIKLLLAVWAHAALRDEGHPWGDGQWTDNPFQELSSCDEFMSDTTSWLYQERLYRYIIARWGYSRAIGLWHTIVEIEGTGTTSSITSTKSQWHQKITQYFQTNDPFGHLVSGSNTHYSGLWTTGYAAMDAPQIHVYQATGSAIDIAFKIADWTADLRQGWNNPAMIGEFGTSDQSLQPDHIHNGAWAGLASGGAISPLDWNDGGAWGDMTAEMYASMNILADFVEDIPFGTFQLTPVTPYVDGCSAWGMQKNDFVFGWILGSASGAVTGKTLTLTGMDDGAYTVQWWNTWTGEIQRVAYSVINGNLMIVVPDFSKDMAYKVMKQ